MSIRLETVSENLTARITAANPSQRRNAITVACELAVQATGMNIPIVTESLMQDWTTTSSRQLRLTMRQRWPWMIITNFLQLLWKHCQHNYSRWPRLRLSSLPRNRLLRFHLRILRHFFVCVWIRGRFA